MKAGLDERKTPLLPLALSFVSASAFLLFLQERAPFAQPAGWTEKRFMIHQGNSVHAELGMVVCATVTLILFVTALWRYFRTQRNDAAQS